MTDGYREIGAVIALALAENGADVALTHQSQNERAQAPEQKGGAPYSVREPSAETPTAPNVIRRSSSAQGDGYTG